MCVCVCVCVHACVFWKKGTDFMGFNVCVLMCMLVCACAFVQPPAMPVERMYGLYESHVCVC